MSHSLAVWVALTLYTTILCTECGDTVFPEEAALKMIEAQAMLSPTHQLSVSIKMNEEHDSLELDFVGPSDAYYAVGFGSLVMLDTWTVVVNGVGDNGWFEQTLSYHTAGEEMTTKSFEMLRNVLTPQDSLRRLQLKTPLTSLGAHGPLHPFDIDEDSIDVIWAVGSDNDFEVHTDSGSQTLFYADMSIAAELEAPRPPTNVWFYDGSLSVSALVVIVGMSALFVALSVYYGYRCVMNVQWRWWIPTDSDEEEEKTEKTPLMSGGDSGYFDVDSKFIAL